jgi:methylenetetrahydrofolate dehydrogenase (NADP+) / methenyltetrahydrofolate cyclohydrolase
MIPATKILDGKSLAASMERDIASRVARLKAANGGHTPTLATILVGSDPASATYVRMKGNACRRVGMESVRVDLPSSTTTEALLSRIDVLNADPSVNGILLQHPVPHHIDERTCFDRIRADKDVDGVTALGFGRMSLGESAYGSATPTGIMRLLAHHGIPIAGKHAVVVGRSPILGKPMAMMLLNANATVTICHSHTMDVAGLVRGADIVVAAVGKPRFVRGEWIRKGAVIVDAGYHPGNVGDVDLESAAEHASAYTPVPGGVGPMTIATLLDQTATAAERATTSGEDVR